MRPAIEIRPNTLLRDPSDGGVLSFRCRVMDAAIGSEFNPDDVARYLAGEVDRGELEIVEGVEPDVPTCRECGCTENFACDDPVTGAPCRWVFVTSSTTSLLCTACATASAS